MTIKTISYIHELLITNEATKQNWYQNAKSTVIYLEAEEPDDIDAIEIAEADRKRARDAWNEAISALHDFEEKEWN